MKKLTINQIIGLAEKSMLKDSRPKYLKERLAEIGYSKAYQNNAVYYNFLYLLAKKLQPNNVLELGTGRGAGTMNLKKGYIAGNVFSVDNNNQPERELLEKIGVHVIDGDCLKKGWWRPIDLLFVDSNFSSEQTKRAFEIYFPCVISGGVIVFDDLNAIREFWNSLKMTQKTDLSFLHHTSGFGVVIKD